MAEIIKLEEFRRSVRAPSGVSFPTVHRVSGCSWRAPDDGGSLEDLTPDPSWPYREYTLAPETPGAPGATSRIANLTSEPITRLDPALDWGWVIVRHHANHDIARAYLDGLHDCERVPSIQQKMWQTADGIFTLHHREAMPRCRDCLLIYSVSAHDELANGWPPIECWYHIVAGDGSTFSDPDILLCVDDL